jgi:hypothetical protein
LDEERALQEDLCSHILAKVLLPTDLSEPARAAIFFVAKLRGIKNMVLLHVVTEGGSKEEMDAKVKAATNALNALAKSGQQRRPEGNASLGVRLVRLLCGAASAAAGLDCHVVVGI